MKLEYLKECDKVNTTVNLNLKKPEGTDVVNIADINSNMDVLDQAVANKVDKVLGKQLSTEDYTTAEKSKLASIAYWEEYP